MKRAPLFVTAAAIILLGAACAKKPATPSASNGQTNTYSQNESINTPNTPTPNDTTMSEPSKEGTVVLMKTSKGDITLQLFDSAAPKTVKNFLDLAADHFYDAVQFHRVIPQFMIQGGDPLTKSQPKNLAIHGTGGPGYKFEDEFNAFKLVKGRLAMANAGPNTNGSQFFIVTADATPWLDGRHTVFGEVINGMDVVSAIEKVQTGANDHPVDPVTITSIEIVPAK